MALVVSLRSVVTVAATVCTLITVISTAKQNITPERRIIGGHSSPKHAAPWIISLGPRPLSTTCGAALLRPSWVVTAAHCMRRYTEQPSLLLHMYAGLDRLDRRNDPQVQYRVAIFSDVRVHPKWPGGVGSFDIALIHVLDPFRPDGWSVVEIGLPAAGSVATGMADLYGWGSTNSKSTEHVKSIKLQTVQLPLISLGECRETYGKHTLSSESNICAGERGEKESGCRGDSGGPLTQDGRTLIGVVSWGIFPCSRRPTVFTGIALMLDWIESHIDGEDE